MPADTIPTDALTTIAERTEFASTGRFEEVERLCRAYADHWPDAVRQFEYGRTPEDRPLLALVVSRCGTLDVAQIRGRRVPVLLIQAGIHPGECDGKDAGFIALRALLDARGALEHLAVLFVPVFNTDGHERFGAANRVNQNGPDEMGWRATAQNLNLNRDYTKAEAPEMQAMLRLMDAWDPLLCADMHVGDGADFEHDVSIQVEPLRFGAPELFPIGAAIRDGLIAALEQDGSLPLTFYPVLRRPDDPDGGFVDYVYSPCYSTGYWPLRNRFTVLVETHSWKRYARRVRATRVIIDALVGMIRGHGADWLAAVAGADAMAANLGGSDMVLHYAVTDAAIMIDFRGYAFTRRPSSISGALMTTYDPTQPRLWQVPLRRDLRPTIHTRVPRIGYLIPRAFKAKVEPYLGLHGIAFEALGRGLVGVEVEAFRADSVTFSTHSFEGHTRTALTGEWRREVVDLANGGLFVPVAQPRVRVLMALLEPRAPDSLAAWGFFNACFERKEYMEAYVAEKVARDLLAGNAELADEFARRLDADAEFAGSPALRLDFFYQHHSSWDTRFRLYPIFRVDTPAATP